MGRHSQTCPPGCRSSGAPLRDCTRTVAVCVWGVRDVSQLEPLPSLALPGGVLGQPISGPPALILVCIFPVEPVCGGVVLGGGTAGPWVAD